MSWKFPYTEPQCKKYIYVKKEPFCKPFQCVIHRSYKYTFDLFKSFDGKLSWKSTWEFEKPRIQSGFLCQVASCYKTLVRFTWSDPSTASRCPNTSEWPRLFVLRSNHRRRQNQGSNCLSCCSCSSQIKGISGQNICVCRSRPKKVVFCILHVIKTEPR